MKYILASASPRRKELMTQAGFSFEVVPSQVEETISQTRPADIVTELSAQKALEVYERLQPKYCTVIGADTIVVYRDEILGKPADEAEALDMLSLLAGRTHQVYTGVTLVRQAPSGSRPKIHSFYEKTDVEFYPIHREDLLSYIRTGDPLDKAGSYGIQGPFAIHVKGIRGDYNNVVGLPIARLYQEIRQF
ncbi:MAG: Maf family protein [Massilistercora timonensis]|uniref:Maf family protein n=1 Tax=Massilistercora timonensis TaxID=2086584 RepID=UPI002FA9D804